MDEILDERQAALLPGLLDIKPAQQREILAFGSFSSFFSGAAQQLPPALAAPLRAFQQQRTHFLAHCQTLLEDYIRRGISVLPFSDPAYPALLREIPRPPPVLYVKGDVAALSLPQIAIVGSRHGSRSGVQVAESFAASLAASGFAVTSGMALGIDAAAHRGALRAGKTLAVLAGGVDVIYPRQHRELYGQILDRGGAILSEMPPGSQPQRHFFPQRNRLISGLATGVLVVEAALKSGSLITARQAMEQGREVFAVPGSIHNPLARGCHQLIREGATLTETLTDMVDQLGGMLAFKAQEAGLAATPQPQDAREQAVFEKLGFDPVDFDTLAKELALPAAELTGLLVSLELQGLVENIAGFYQRIG